MNLARGLAILSTRARTAGAGRHQRLNLSARDLRILVRDTKIDPLKRDGTRLIERRRQIVDLQQLTCVVSSAARISRATETIVDALRIVDTALHSQEPPFSA
jgi:hypothetical protein